MGLEHEPLDLSSRQIRLLTLLPASDTLNDPVSATLEIYSLNDKPEFEALSYVWGDEKDKRDVIVNGQTTKVTQNLEAALRRLRESAPRVLWVDALCINQEDVAEKNHQVPFMTQIYTTCQQAIIWLGEGNNRIEALFQWLESARFEESADNETSLDTTISKRLDNEAAYLGYLDVFELPYWQRMWTYQEMILPANDPICVYGNHSSPFSMIAETQTYFDLLEGYDPKLLGIELAKSGISSEEQAIREDECIKIALVAKKTRGRREKTSLALSLYLSVGRASKDPRDRIYALYGLHPDIQRLYPAEYKDYRRSLDRVLAETTVYLVMHDSGFMVLARNFRMHPNRFSEGPLPSWVPDYNVITERYHDWTSAISLRRWPTGSPKPSTRERGTTMMVNNRSVNVRSHQEPISTAVLADLSDSMLPNEQENGFASFPVNGIEADLLSDAGYDLHQAIAAASEEGQHGEEIPSRFLIQGGRLTLRLAGRHIGVCEKIHIFDADRTNNRIKLYQILEEAKSNPNLLDMMLLALMRPTWRENVANFSLEEIRTACEVALSREPSGGTKLDTWLLNKSEHEARREMSSAEADEEKRLLRLFFDFVVDSFAITLDKTLLVTRGEPVLVGIGEEAFRCGDIIMTPVHVFDHGGPLVLRKLSSIDANTAGQESQNQQAHTNGEGTVYYKLVGPVMIPALTEESELVSRLAQRPVEDFFIQ